MHDECFRMVHVFDWRHRFVGGIDFLLVAPHQIGKTPSTGELVLIKKSPVARVMTNHREKASFCLAACYCTVQSVKSLFDPSEGYGFSPRFGGFFV